MITPLSRFTVINADERGVTIIGTIDKLGYAPSSSAEITSYVAERLSLGWRYWRMGRNGKPHPAERIIHLTEET